MYNVLQKSIISYTILLIECLAYWTKTPGSIYKSLNLVYLSLALAHKTLHSIPDSKFYNSLGIHSVRVRVLYLSQLV